MTTTIEECHALTAALGAAAIAESDAAFLGELIAEAVAEWAKDVNEAYASVSLDNGPATVRVSAFTQDAAELQAVGQRAAAAALAGLQALDPDNDGDVDVHDGPTCPFCAAAVPDGANFCPSCGQPQEPAAEAAPVNTGGSPVGDTPTNGGATESAPVTMTAEQLQAFAANAAKAALEAAGITAPVEESEELKAARRLVAEADGARTTDAHTHGTTEAAPAGPLTADAAKAMIDEALAKQAEAYESKLDEARKIVQLRGPQRQGFIAESESAEQLYGDDPEKLRTATLQDLEKTADAVVYPLIAR